MALSARDESGRAVDWWFMYKVPKLTASGQSDAATGYEYVYYDSAAEAAGQNIVRSPYGLDSDSGALFHTLDALFASPTPDTGWLLYNDEVPPSGPTSLTLGHTKGVLGFDLQTGTGFWLLHSWPKFPLPDDSAQPSPMYGQTFLCLSLDLDTMRKLAEQMHQYQEPQVYDPRVPNSLADDDALRLLSAGVTDKDAAGSNMLELKTLGGLDFRVIAKNRNWNDDFWNDLVVDDIKADIAVDTWVNGPGAIPGTSDRSGTYRVEDIKYISFQDLGLGLNWSWPETRDHAKWAISEQGEGNWVCVGDINRKTTQRTRGGCTIAMQNDQLWALLSKVDKFVPPEGSGLTQTDLRRVVAERYEQNRQAAFKTPRRTRLHKPKR